MSETELKTAAAQRPPAKSRTTPQLRFPEFQNQAEWEFKKVEDCFTVGSSKRVLQRDWIDEGVPFLRTRELVPLSKNEPFKSEIFISEGLFTKISENYGLPAEGDFLVSGVGTLGVSYQVQPSDRFYFKDGNVLWFKSKKNIISNYFKYCFQADGIQSQISGQASISTVGTYTINNAKKTSFWCPPHIQEQQKIADCLSSIDELITAQTQKVNALKAHKKGLMQQLFPTQGETTPQLRFPEFHNQARWSQENLVNPSVSFLVKDRAPLDQLSLDSYVSTENLLPDYAGIYHASKLPLSGSFTRYEKEDVLISNIRPYLRKVWWSDRQGATSNDVIVFRSGKDVYPSFLLHVLKNDSFINYMMKGAKGIKMPRGDIASIKKYPVAYPEQKEQQKIADCLSSIDELITAQTQKVNALKAHKKGLMQQLFPPAATSTRSHQPSLPP